MSDWPRRGTSSLWYLLGGRGYRVSGWGRELVGGFLGSLRGEKEGEGRRLVGEGAREGRGGEGEEDEEEGGRHGGSGFWAASFGAGFDVV